MFICVGFQNGINAYILPSAECDLDLTSEQKGLLNVAFLLGIETIMHFFASKVARATFRFISQSQLLHFNLEPSEFAKITRNFTHTRVCFFLSLFHFFQSFEFTKIEIENSFTQYIYCGTMQWRFRKFEFYWNFRICFKI